MALLRRNPLLAQTNATAVLFHGLDQAFDIGQIVVAKMLAQPPGEEFSSEREVHSICLSTHPTIEMRVTGG